MNGPVIACVDEGADGTAAARVGARLARQLCSPLMLATVSSFPPHNDGFEAAASLLRMCHGKLAQTTVSPGADVELRVEFGEPAERLTSLAQRERASLLVIGVSDRNANGRQRLGNAYLALAGASPCPVVAVPPAVTELPRGMGPIVCGVDGSDRSLAAIAVAVELAAQLEAPVQLVHVAERPRLAGSPGDPRSYGTRLVATHAAAMRVLLRAAEVPQAALDLRVELGHPAERMADLAAREGALLIVNGSQGRGYGRAALLGSVSSELVRGASQPVVLVGPRAARADLDGRRDRGSASAGTARRRPPAPAHGRGRPIGAL